MFRFAVAFALASALPLHAERVRVVIAVDVPAYSASSVSTLRADVMESLETARAIERWGEGRAFSAEVDRAELDRLRRDPRVRAVAIDDGGEGSLLESVPLVGANVAHAQKLDGAGVTVAVLDTGIDANHPDFAGRVVAQQCFCDNLDGSGCCPSAEREQSGPGAAYDDHGHGTHVAGIIAGAGNAAPHGVAPRARIVAVKVMDSASSFRSFTQIYRALEWIDATRKDVRVINMSLGSHALYSTFDCGSGAIALGMRDVVNRLRARGVLITASTGNHASTTGTTLPACMTEVLAVGATYDVAGEHRAFCPSITDTADQVACFTNSTDAMDIVAPGSSIVASRRGGGSIIYDGTSMAAPHVAGAIALMQQLSGNTITADETETLLKTTGRSVMDVRNGLAFPRLDVAAALAATPKAPPVPRRRSVGR